ncbi:hypothetical protein PIB30_044980 [Stylosanthes scabra]|uniref:Uncharacterized protein n=1 Tax=Stylosanthes scabra TaxID=79078 RepID=A0ABU6VH03_9FABA|nr:hypothetical protein [Stylosanthes scabra]
MESSSKKMAQEVEAVRRSSSKKMGQEVGAVRRYKETLENDWKASLGMFTDEIKENEEQPAEDLLESPVTKYNDTLLHVIAMHGSHDFFKKFLDLIPVRARRGILSVKNKNGDTALHLAAERGSLDICKLIIIAEEEEREGGGGSPSLVHIRNHRLETPLFLAALHGYKDAFNLLHNHSQRCKASGSSRSSGMPWRRERGETILHCTLEREHFDLAYEIVHLYEEEGIMVAVDEKGITPLHVLATKPSAFKSSTNFGFWRTLLYKCTIVEQLRKPDSHQKRGHTLEYSFKNLFIFYTLQFLFKKREEATHIIYTCALS